MLLPLPPPLSILPHPLSPAPIGLFLQCASREDSWLQYCAEGVLCASLIKSSSDFSEGPGSLWRLASPESSLAKGDVQPFELLQLFSKVVREEGVTGIRTGEGPWGLFLLWDLQRGHSGLEEGPCPTLQTGTTAEL